MDGSAVIGATGRGRAVGQSTVDDQSSGAVDIGYGDQRLVQGRVTSVTNKVIQIFLVRVLVAAAWTVLLAQAGNRECLVRSIWVCLVNIGLVVEPVRVSGIVSRKTFEGSSGDTYEKW
jgi:hypothetical protein